MSIMKTNIKPGLNESWTIEEIQIWAKAGLIPNELLHSSKYIDLALYIVKHKETLYQHYRSDQTQFDCHVMLPPSHKFLSTYELQVIDTTTGKVVKTLEQVRSFELCDGLSIEIKAKELEQWKKDTVGTKALTKEQTEIFKDTIAKIGPKRSLSRQEIVTLLEEVLKKRKASKVRHSGLFTDNKLQHYDQKKKQNKFENLSPELKEFIKSSGVTIKTLGIKLTTSEDKLVNALYKLLHDKSENKKTESTEYYKGNEIGELLAYGNEKIQPSILKIWPSELYREYTGKDDYAGQDIINVNNILKNLSEKKYVIIYDKQRLIKSGKKEEKVTDRIEEVAPLIRILSYFDSLTDQQVKKLDSGDRSLREKKTELIIAFHPIITDQINSKYIEYPEDINRKTMIASGGPLRITESIIDLRDYLMRELSNKRYNPEIDEETLIDQIRLRDIAKSGRRKRLHQRISDAIEANKKLGLILESKTDKGSKGQVKHIFTLNKNFE